MACLTRVGLVGTDSSHADEIIRLINVEHRVADMTITAMCSADRDRLASLRHFGDVAVATSRCTDLLGLVDAVIVAHRDGDRHKADALPFLRAGIPVYVDKPLAISLDDAKEMIDTAEREGTLLTSYSPLRWLAAVQRLSAAIEHDLRRPVAVHGRSYLDPFAPQKGLFFYGIHLADVVCRLLDGRIGRVDVEWTSDQLRVVGSIGEVELFLRLEFRRTALDAAFEVVVETATGRLRELIELDRDYMLPALDAFRGMLDSRIARLPAAELLRPLELLTEAERVLAGSARSTSPGDPGFPT